MLTEHFYTKLPTLQSFLAITNPNNFTPVPDDWHIIVTDITGSTKLIEAGRYKDVNLLGVSSIAAVLNIADVDIPFVFGGDGGTILIPPTLLTHAKLALPATQRIARTEFGMELRIGIVPVLDVTRAGYAVDVAKVKVSDNYSQAAFIGGGLNHATDLVKNPALVDRYHLQEFTDSEANLTGLECRWQDIPSRHGEVVSLLVMAMARSSLENYAIYQDVVETIMQIYGDDDRINPVCPANLKLTFNVKRLMAETKLRSKSGRWRDRLRYLLQIILENLLGLMLMTFKITIGPMPWGGYKHILTAATDYKKFDDMLRMVISGNSSQRQQLTAYLETCFSQGKLVYGLHTSDRALMTCLVFERHGRQMHFIDGADGGYALAAKSMKQQLEQKAVNWRTFNEMVRLRQGGKTPRV